MAARPRTASLRPSPDSEPHDTTGPWTGRANSYPTDPRATDTQHVFHPRNVQTRIPMRPVSRPEDTICVDRDRPSRAQPRKRRARQRRGRGAARLGRHGVVAHATGAYAIGFRAPWRPCSWPASACTCRASWCRTPGHQTGMSPTCRLAQSSGSQRRPRTACSSGWTRQLP